MAQTDYIRSVELTNNTNNIKSKSITGKTFVADYGNNYWTIAIKTIPMSQNDFYENFIPAANNSAAQTGLFWHLAGSNFSRSLSAFKLPVLKDKRGTASGTVTVLNENSTAPAYNKDIGSNTVGVNGTATGTLLAGDLIKFSGHSKVYMITADVNLDGSTKDTISFTPRLIAGVGGNTITYSNVPFTVVPDGDFEEWQTAGASAANFQSTSLGTTNSNQFLYEYEQTFREVV
tara:strand:+ start:19724 stop:20419 length:696 start_codon:yes stop_codon:yes gene_type:complete